MSREIGNIFLSWKKGSGFGRIVVGKLKVNRTDGVTFEYIEKKISEAKRQGFTVYTGFPDLEKKYTKNVLDIFSQRLIKIERNDVSDFYDFWSVDLSKRSNTIYMLAQTQGLLPTDNFEFLADFNPVQGLRFISEIAGLSNNEINSTELRVGDNLVYKLEPQNSYDDKAVGLYKSDKKIGYIKIIHSRVFHKSKRRLKVTVHHMEGSPVLTRVFIKIEI